MKKQKENQATEKLVDDLNSHFRPFYVLEQLKEELQTTSENGNFTKSDIKLLCGLILNRIKQLENEYGTYETI